MASLSEGKQAAIAALVCAAPDPVLQALERAFANAPLTSGAGFVRTAVCTERRDRQCRAAAFAPLLPLFRPRPDGVEAAWYPAAAARLLWEEIKTRRPQAVEQLDGRLRALEYDETVPAPILDGFCAEAAAMLREGDPARWGLADEAQAESLARAMDLAPVVRRSLPHLDAWLGRVTDERAAALRLVFKDATAIADDATPRLMEIFLAHLPEAHLILRLIPVLTHGAGEGLVAGSELAPLGERLLADAEGRLERAGRFGLKSDLAEARRTARELAMVSAILVELDACLELSREGHWGRRAAAGRDRAGAILEKNLKLVDKAVAKALPVTQVRISGRVSRPAPDVAADPAAPAVDQARTLLTLLSESRNLAAAIGCGATRTQACDAVGERLDTYVEELLHSLHAGELSPPDEARARALLDLAAEFLGLVRDEKAARLVRRRVAVAVAADAANGLSQQVA